MPTSPITHVQQQGLELVQRDVPVGQPGGEAGGVERQRPWPGDQRPERGVGAVERAEPVPVRAGGLRGAGAVTGRGGRGVTVRHGGSSRKGVRGFPGSHERTRPGPFMDLRYPFW